MYFFLLFLYVLPSAPCLSVPRLLKGVSGRESHTLLYYQLSKETQRIHLVINKQYVSDGFAPERMHLTEVTD